MSATDGSLPLLPLAEVHVEAERTLDERLWSVLRRTDSRDLFDREFQGAERRPAQRRALELLHGVPWSDAENDLLRARWSDENIRTLAKHFPGRGDVGVQRHAPHLGLVYTVPQGYITVSLAARQAGMSRQEFFAAVGWFHQDRASVASTYNEPLVEPDMVLDIPMLIDLFMRATHDVGRWCADRGIRAKTVHEALQSEGTRASPWGWRAADHALAKALGRTPPPTNATFPVFQNWAERRAFLQPLMACLGAMVTEKRSGRLHFGIAAGLLIDAIIERKAVSPRFVVSYGRGAP